jgi:hypothetical protein
VGEDENGANPPAMHDAGLRERAPAKGRWDASPPARGEQGRLRWRNLLDGYRPPPIPAHRGLVEDPSPGVAGICCSGGGIRSAAFNLGALQSLQSADRLQSARYLSAVSGGSYIAAAFAMVRMTADPDLDSDADLIADEPPFKPGSPEVQYLRNHCDYLAPDGIDKLYLGYRIVLGLVVNVIFVALPIFGLTVLLGVFAYRHTFATLVTCVRAGDCHRSVHLPLWCWLVPVALAGLSVVLGLVLLLARLGHEWMRNMLRVWSTRLLLAAVGVALLTVALPELVALLHVHGSGGGGATGTNAAKPVATGAVGLAGLLAGIVAAVRELFAKAETALTGFQKLSARVRRAIIYLAGGILGPLLLYGVVVFAMSLTLANASTSGERWWLIGVGFGALAAFAALYGFADLSSWSLHPYYKRQLCTAFALRRVPTEHPADEQQRVKGVAVERDYDTPVPLSQTGLERYDWPTLLVCAAANISDPGATPPGRHVTSFTFSAHTVGGPLVGGIETDAYEQACTGNARRSRDLTLPAAVAMSGAALAPSMGKLTMRPLTFLIALANIRLGVWLPNPRWVAGEGRLGRWSRPRPSYLIRELIGRNRVEGKYLFVTDGGHYENLGLVELLRRGCTAIYCFDAGGGETFSELGDAVALARSELGVQIDIDPTPLMPRSAKQRMEGSEPEGAGAQQNAGAQQGNGAGAGAGAGAGTGANAGAGAGAGANANAGANAATGPKEDDVALENVILVRFAYPDGTPAVLVYARNVMTEKAPWDVRAHHREEPSFPHDSTADQIYTDQKFESYRALGAQAGARAVELMAAAEAAG